MHAYADTCLEKIWNGHTHPHTSVQPNFYTMQRKELICHPILCFGKCALVTLEIARQPVLGSCSLSASHDIPGAPPDAQGLGMQLPSAVVLLCWCCPPHMAMTIRQSLMTTPSLGHYWGLHRQGQLLANPQGWFL